MIIRHTLNLTQSFSKNSRNASSILIDELQNEAISPFEVYSDEIVEFMDNNYWHAEPLTVNEVDINELLSN